MANKSHPYKNTCSNRLNNTGVPDISDLDENENNDENYEVYESERIMSRRERLVELDWQKYLDYQVKNPSWTTATRPLDDLDDNTGRLDNPESDIESEHSDHPTDYEQSGDEDVQLSPSDFTLGKDKTCWNLHPSRKNVRTGK
ncbi:hypothetical protein FQA39_LY05519 [Lamprigera yunnana]|nr:hypothetical protein FQA39_LY05519 [Lamprigera yunnana]